MSGAQLCFARMVHQQVQLLPLLRHGPGRKVGALSQILAFHYGECPCCVCQAGV